MLTRRPKRSAAEAGLDAPPSKRAPSFSWRDFVNRVRGIDWNFGTFLRQRSEFAAILKSIGACDAAISNVRRSKAALSTAIDFIDERATDGSLAALRLHALIGCPGPKDAESTNVPCRRKHCPWRMDAHELQPPTSAPLFQVGGAIDAFPLAQLPYEIVCHIVRLVAYDFGLLQRLRSTCRALRDAVDSTLPRILIDCSMIEVVDGRWKLTNILPDVLSQLPKTRQPVARLVERPCAPCVGALLAQPGRALSVLADRSDAVWSSLIVGRQWGVDYMHRQAFMRPFPTDDAVAHGNLLCARIRQIANQNIFAPAFTTMAHAERWLQVVDDAFAQAPIINAGLDALCVDHALKYGAIDRPLFVRRFVRYCSSRALAFDVAPVNTAAAAQRLLQIFRDEAQAVDACAAERELSFSVLYAHGFRLLYTLYKDIGGIFSNTTPVFTRTKERVDKAAQHFNDTALSIRMSSDEVLREIDRCNLPAALVTGAMRAAVGRSLLTGIAAYTIRLRGNPGADAHVAAICAEFTPVLEAVART
jgi:hypothetical protein